MGTEVLAPGECPSPKLIRHQVQVRLQKLQRHIRRLEGIDPSGDELANLLGWKAEAALYNDILAVLDAYAFAHALFEPLAMLVQERIRMIDEAAPIDSVRAIHIRVDRWMDKLAVLKWKERRAQSQT